MMQKLLHQQNTVGVCQGQVEGGSKFLTISITHNQLQNQIREVIS